MNSVFQYLFEYNRYLSIIGIAVIIGIAILFSKKRRDINYRLIFAALGLQFFIALFTLKLSFGQKLIGNIADGVKLLYNLGEHGAAFVFGPALSDPMGPWGFIFAIKLLPIIVFFGAFMALLFHFGIVQKVVTVISWVIRPVLGTSGAETLCAISNSFLGQTEAPLLIRNYLKNMTKSEILVVMISGMATVSGSLLAAFAGWGIPAEHLLTTSVMSIPGSILISKVLLPETEQAETAGGAQASIERTTSNMFDAIAVGTSDGLNLALNVGAMLVAFVALLKLVDIILGTVGLDTQIIFSFLFKPFAYLLGFTGSDANNVATLLGTKVAVNEFLAFDQLRSMDISFRAKSIVTYALCGFSNFSCIGIQLGGIGALVPEKRKWLSELGLYAVMGGALTNLMSAMIANILL